GRQAGRGGRARKGRAEGGRLPRRPDAQGRPVREVHLQRQAVSAREEAAAARAGRGNGRNGGELCVDRLEEAGQRGLEQVVGRDGRGPTRRQTSASSGAAGAEGTTAPDS